MIISGLFPFVSSNSISNPTTIERSQTDIGGRYSGPNNDRPLLIPAARETEKPYYISLMEENGIDMNTGRSVINVYSSEYTVGEKDADFTSIKAAIADPAVSNGSLLILTDPVHTENDIMIDKDISIKSFSGTVLQAADALSRSRNRVFTVPEGKTLKLFDLDLRYGNPDDTLRSGGIVLNEGTLFVENCIVHDNQGNCGAAVYNSRGTAVAVNSLFFNNAADGANTDGKDCGSGGAIKSLNASLLLLLNCGFFNNNAAYGAGAVKISCSSTAVMINSSFCNNTCRSSGGAINSGGDLYVVHCTFSLNSADGVLRGGRTLGGKSGGGIFNRGNLRLINSILAGNKSGRDIVNSETDFIENTGNWIGDGSVESAFSGDPLLIIKSYSHIALDRKSGAIDASSPDTSFISFDRLYNTRKKNRITSSGWADLGAFEYP